MAHPKGPTDYPNDRFTKEQIKILKAEPMLKVEFIPDEKPRKNKGGDK